MECLGFGKLKNTCCDNFIDLKELSEEDRLTFLSDFGLLKTKKAYICKSHITELKNRRHNRLRATHCSLPECIATHKDRRRADRHLGVQNIQTLYSRSGIVFAIGTAICKKCRTTLLDLPETNNDSDFQSDNKGNQCQSRRDDIQHERVKRPRKEISAPSENSQESPQPDADSQTSVASGSSFVQLEALNKFLCVSGMSPVKELQGSVWTSSKATQNKYINKAKKCVDLLFDTICPNEGDFLKSNIMQEREHEDVTLSTLAGIYNIAETWKLQRQILSIISKEHSFEEAQTLMPDVTRYRFTEARKHAEYTGVGYPVEAKQQHRVKFDSDQLEHFVDFITSDHIIKDLPFGEKTLKLTSGEVIQIPLVIRSLAPSTIISQYSALCKEENVRPLGKSTMFKILDECSATVRRSVEGLDNFVMEGSRAFGQLETVLDQMKKQDQEVTVLKEGLLEGKRYLKSEFKAHVVRESTVADHCLSYALSSNGEPYFTEPCQHSHDKTCGGCDNLEHVLNRIKDKVESSDTENMEAVMYTVEESILAIQKWKAHITRSKCQEEAKTTLVNKMTDEDVIITCDWAMKFLPRKYREGQIDWFAKRGINWHVAVSLVKLGSTFLTVTHLHIFDGPISQDATVTVETLVDIYRDIKIDFPKLKRVYFISDNAGCYKSSETLLRLHKDLGEHMQSYDFSEAQNGKGPCDRRASHVKAIIRRYINEGHDVTSAQQMKQAIDQARKKDIKTKVVAVVNTVDTEKSNIKKTIPLVSQLYNFEYYLDKMVVYRAFSVGKGKSLNWDTLDCPNKSVELSTVMDWGKGELSRLSSSEENESTGSGHTPENEPSLFDCPNEGCGKTFKTSKFLDEHIILGNCSVETAKLTVKDRAKSLYSTKLLSLYPSRDVTILGSDTINSPSAKLCEMGWALKEGRVRVIFSDKQKSFLTDKYNYGKLTGRKVDPYVAAADMRIDGSFKRDEFLSGQQIASFFSRLCQKEKKTTKEDYEAAKIEDSKENLKIHIGKLLE